MKLTKKEAIEVVTNCHEDWEPLYDTEEIVSKRRWESDVYGVFKHLPSGKYYDFCWTIGNTESQPNEYFYDDEIEVGEVVEKEVVVKQWVSKELGE